MIEIVSLGLLIGFVGLVTWWLRSRGRARLRRPVLLLLVLCGTTATLGFLWLAVSALDEWERTGQITSCRVPLEKGHTCRGFNDSWIECRWAFRAEGRPTRSLCRRFVSQRPSPGREGDVSDYEDVSHFAAVECEGWGIAEDDYLCFTGSRTEHEAVNRYMLAFTRDCEAAVVLRTCNLPLEDAAKQ